MRHILLFSFLLLMGSCSIFKVDGTHVLRLLPHDDLKQGIERYLVEHKIASASIVSGIGSLTIVNVRHANASKGTLYRGHFEILSLNGTMAKDGGHHLHIAFADEKGKAFGGHLLKGSIIYTTAEITLIKHLQIHLSRKPDKLTGYNELNITRFSTY